MTNCNECKKEITTVLVSKSKPNICKKCISDKNKKYYKENKTYLKYKQTERRKINPEYNKIKAKEWRKSNPERMKELKKNWIIKNPEKYKMTRRKSCNKIRKTKLSKLKKFRDRVLSLSKGCKNCGLLDVRYLQFDHIDRNTKTYTISKMISKSKFSIKDIKQEMRKCQILCYACHKEKTSKEMKSRTKPVLKNTEELDFLLLGIFPC